MLDFKQYIKELQSVPIEEITEHSKRFALETLLRELASGYAAANNIKVLHEPKRKENYGSPDFKIYTDSSIIGYVENKKITENLDKTLKSDQIKKYRELSQNILLTNYIEFVWIKGDSIQRETLCYLSDLENKKFKPDNEKAEKVYKILTNFFSQAPVGLANAKDLALALAIRAKNLKIFLNDELIRQENNNEKDYLVGLYEIFKSNVFNALTISEFSDAFAQMLVYGLFLAKLNADTKDVTLENAKKFIPKSFELIRELVGFLEQLDNRNYQETKWIIDETISIMNNLNLIELKKSLSFNKKVKDNENNETDPYIYFYETFLAAYDSSLRKSKGVYYTPPQVVNLIVSSVNSVLKKVFNIVDGFAAPNTVTVLDFATGTGTFLTEILKQIFETFPLQSMAMKDMIIKEHILKNIYGFEYLIAPYTIAHLKLSQFLKENGYDLTENDRFQLFLTNTLEPIADIPPNIFVPHLSEEGKLAQKVKDKPILVITGNPPYSGHSKNKGQWIDNLIKGVDIWAKEKIDYQANYYIVDGVSLGEKNPKWLQDDYVKFIRFAQYKIDKAGQGVVGIITNHSFLDNPTFRGMRQSLMKSFDQLYFIDLHGNAKKKEKTPGGEKDQNVFDIEQGVSISILIKKKGLEKKVFHSDFWGTRAQKFEQCLNNTIETIDFQELQPNSPFYLFVPQNKDLRKSFENYWLITDIFEKYSLGVFTHRDHFLVDFDKEKLNKRIKNFTLIKDPQEVRETFQINDTRDWKIDIALKQMQNETIKIENIFYRPFDKRFVCYNQPMFDRGTSRTDLFSGFLEPNSNVGLIVGRAGQNVAKGLWNLLSISDCITDTNIFYRGGGSVFPLYKFNGNGKNGNLMDYLFKEDDKKDNFTEKFRVFIKNYYTNNPKHATDNEKLKKEIKLMSGIIKNAQTTIKDMKKLGMDEISIHSEELRLEETKAQFEQKQIELNNPVEQQSNFIPSPEQLLGYMYSIMHSPTYRKKYAEFLKIDFPRIPFCKSSEKFQQLSNLGLQLKDYHLLIKEPVGTKFDNLGIYEGEGDDMVLKPELKIIKTNNCNRNSLFINKTQFFDNVTEEIYEFHIGGYQVLDKYLKDRKNKKLVLSEILNISKIVKTIAFTIYQMELIDNETKDWI